MNINETVIISANHRHRWISQIPNMNKIPTIYHTLETVELKLEQIYYLDHLVKQHLTVGVFGWIVTSNNGIRILTILF